MVDKLGGFVQAFAAKLPNSVTETFSGARGVKSLINSALTPDPDNVSRISDTELGEIVTGYRKTEGRWLDGRASVEAYAAAQKPALVEALRAAREGQDDLSVWSAYTAAQMRWDLSHTTEPKRELRASDLPGGETAQMMAQSAVVLAGVLKGGMAGAAKNNQTANLIVAVVEKAGRGGALSDAEFATIQAAANDPAQQLMFAKSLSSVNAQVFDYFKGNPAPTPEGLGAFIRNNGAM